MYVILFDYRTQIVFYSENENIKELTPLYEISALFVETNGF